MPSHRAQAESSKLLKLRNTLPRGQPWNSLLNPKFSSKVHISKLQITLIQRPSLDNDRSLKYISIDLFVQGGSAIGTEVGRESHATFVLEITFFDEGGASYDFEGRSGQH